eukprot:TRINITY_DN1578_c0_g2_i2.p1 TRINITY_DN1578_c0_g2~~TRINITY_DN1578_c0_g2_i2.p1  ORF type:complete len:987 (+),score=295.45 TRINITY_DN1578_c0_g2_i2:181-3141(+)
MANLGGFGVSVQDLEILCQSRDSKKLNEFEGVKGLEKKLRTNLQKGLSADEAKDGYAKRKEAFGVNSMPEPPATTLLQLILAGLEDKTLIMLMVSAVTSLIFGLYEDPAHGWIEGTAILFAVVLVVMVSSLNDYHKEKQFRKLNEKKNNRQVKVVRGGEQQLISVYDVLVGDIVSMETGDIICADGVFITGDDMRCDESSMTGETDTIKKTENEPFMLASCQVTQGVGSMIVLAVGEHSEAGKALKELQKPNEDTPLQEKLESLAEQIAKVGLCAAILIFVVLVVKLAVLTYIHSTPLNAHLISAIIKYFITSVTIVVVAVPEGLPLAVTIALAYSMMKMLEDQNLVRHLDACETMGGATTICSDKTGTLTMNQMTAMKAWIGGKTYDPIEKTKELNQKVAKAIFESICLNSTAHEAQTDNGQLTFIGSKTETALLNAATNNNFKYNEIRTKATITKSYPFSSAKKSMGTVSEENGNFILHVKGASEVILARCDKFLNGEGNPEDITPALREELDKVIMGFASDGLRTITLGYRDYKKGSVSSWEEEPNDQLVLLGIVGIKDPVRPAVPGAVKQCQRAGIVVRMVTGDNIVTASKIAKECGILTEGGRAIEGPEFRKMTDQQIDALLPTLQVMARSSPTDKHKLVNRLKALGNVVAVTGDGTNDAPALKEAHVGFAMGIAGTDVAKEASDIILMDDNFASIVKAMLWGRNVYDSIRKFLQFQLTVNTVAVTVAFVGAISNEHGESPLKPVQLLWVNLIMDTMAALALATDAPSPDLIDRPPYGKDDKLITNRMTRNILGQALYQLAVNFTVLYTGDHLFGVEKNSVTHLTIIFNTFVWCQIFNELNSRKLTDELNIFYGLHKNLICVGVLVFTCIFQFLIVEFGGEFAGTTPLNFNQWLACLCLGAGGLFWRVLLTRIPVDEALPKRQLPPRTSSKDLNRSRWAKVRQASLAIGVVHSMKKQASLLDSLRRARKIKTVGFYNKSAK